MHLSNKSTRTIEWQGYPSTPWYRIRQRDIFGWHERDAGWFCGKGLETHQLSPMHSVQFYVDLPGSDPRSIQVGLDYTNPPERRRNTVWSAPFSLQK